MQEKGLERVSWKRNPDAVELGFDFYLSLIEKRLKGEEASLVQNLRKYYRDELGIDLRETQARGLMHQTSSVFIDYVASITDQTFVPGIQHWEKEGPERFLAWRDAFYQARSQAAADLDQDIVEELETLMTSRSGPPSFRKVEINRVVRDSALSRFLKALYSYKCQICRFSFGLPSGRRYAESHHIRPLGKKHGGIDKETNMLVLCPNHHAMMDFGVIGVCPDNMTVVSIDPRNRVHNAPVQLNHHQIGKEFLEYHMSCIFGKVS